MNAYNPVELLKISKSSQVDYDYFTCNPVYDLEKINDGRLNSR